MLELTRHRKWRALFIAVSILIFMQVLWWTTAFLRTVDHVAVLEHSLAKVSQGVNGGDAIENRLFRAKFMFLSEGITFLVLLCFGLYLLFRSLKAEEKTLKMQRNFAEILTHESKTPLTALKLRLENILENRKDEALTKELKLSLDEVRRLSSIIEKAISLNRIEASHFVFDEIAVEEVVRQVTKRLEPLFKSHQVEVTLDLQEDSVVKADFLAIQNTVQSLIENAVYYNDRPEKKVLISLKKGMHDLTLSVSDNGPGISLEERQKVFDRFYRGVSVRRIPGTGLGLYLSKLIVEAHKGAIRLVEGEKGCSFEIRLPLYGGVL